MTTQTAPRVLDDFRSADGWQCFTPGTTRLTLSVVPGPYGAALALDYELAENGFVVARRDLALELPESYAFSFRARVRGPRPVVEFKLVEADGHTVWRHRDERFPAAADWQTWTIDCSQIEFAWGPHRSRRLGACAALEIAVVGSGAGTLELADFTFVDTTYRGTPRVRVSSNAHDAAAPDVVRAGGTGWRSGPGTQHWLECAFDTVRSFSAVLLAWRPDAVPTRCVLSVRDADGAPWRQIAAVGPPLGLRSQLLLPGSRAVALRLDLESPPDGCGLELLDIAPWDFARDEAAGWSALASRAPAGYFPKALNEQQSYWTVCGAPAGSAPVLINTEGMVEMDGAEFTVEPMLRADGRLITWADVALEQGLVDDALPLPWVRWRTGDIDLRVALAVHGSGTQAVTVVDYTLQTHGHEARDIELVLLLRPFQVTPPWQRWQHYGGLLALRSLEWRDGAVHVNAARTLQPLTAPDGFGACASAAVSLVDELAAGRLPDAQACTDDSGRAAGALRFHVRVTPDGAATVRCAIPAAGAAAHVQDDLPADPFATARAAWQRSLGDCSIELPGAAAALWRIARTAAAHILVNRQGPRLHPGPRRYVRAYLRDGVVMGVALARLGLAQPLADLLRWYAPHQRDDGTLPDCIDDEGPEWLPEFDAYGQLLHGVAELARLGGDDTTQDALWPHVGRTVAHIERLRARRLGDDYRTGPGAIFCGLLPESMSHEGYMAYPVHAYWDDFWAWRGLVDASAMYMRRGAHAEASRVAALAAALDHDIVRSIERVCAERSLDFLPGAAELGDFDATASAIALTIADAQDTLPRALLDCTFDRQLAIVAGRAGRDDWANYSAYEIRNVGALVRLGRRADALALLGTLVADCRPRGWQQWPEQSWRDPDTPAFLGDLPHSWIGAEYVLALHSLFAYERVRSDELVLGAGVDAAWLDTPAGVAVQRLRTHHGPLSYRLRRHDSRTLAFDIDAGITVPAGGLRLLPPLPAPLRAVEVDGEPHREHDAHGCIVRHVPARVLLAY